MITLWLIGALIFGLVFNAGGLMVYFALSSIISMTYIVNDEVRFESLLKQVK